MSERPSAADIDAHNMRVRDAWAKRHGPIGSEDYMAAIDAKAKVGNSRIAKPARNAASAPRRKDTGYSKATSTLDHPSEHDSQAAVVQWWDWWAPTKGLDYRLLHSIPNAGAGASKGQAGKMKAEGCRPGYPDLALDFPMGNIFHGMRIEMKSWKGRTNAAQRSYHDLLIKHNFNVLVCYSAEEAIRAITAYVERALR